jgi:hypothetical protein
MVKAYWIAIALVAGVAIGLYAGRQGPEAPQPLDSGARPVTPGSPAARSVAAPAATARVDSTPAAGVRASEAPGAGVQFGGAARFQDIQEGGSAPDRVRFADTMEEEFLREARDDSWAYMREAELERLIAPETGAGHFKQERLECRASICLVDLSAQGRQVELLAKWTEAQTEQRTFSLDQPLMMRGSSFSGEGDVAHARFIFVNPRQLMPPPRN